MRKFVSNPFQPLFERSRRLLIDSNCSGINLNMPGNDLNAYLKKLTLLYADDTVISATYPATFQENINAFFEQG